MPYPLSVTDGSLEGSFEVTQGKGTLKRKKRFSWTYLVLSDDTTQDAEDIRRTVGIPRLFSIHRGAVCKGIHPREVETIARHPATGVVCNLWEVRCDFDTDFDPQNYPDTGEDPDSPTLPEDRTPIVRWTSEIIQEPDDVDYEGTPVCTAAKEKIALSFPICLPILTITRYEYAPFDPNVIYNYANHRNSTVFYGAPVGSAVLTSIEAEEEMVDMGGDYRPLKYVRATYTVKFRLLWNQILAAFDEETWDAKVLHQGYYYNEYVPGLGYVKPVKFIDPKTNHPKVVRLDSNGAVLSDTAAPQFLYFKKFPSADLNALSLGPY